MLGLTMSAFLSTSILMMFSGHPLSLLMGILLMSLSCAYMLSIAGSCWFGWGFLMVYVGALLVAYAFISALTPSSVFSWRYLYFSLVMAIAFFFLPWDVSMVGLRPTLDSNLLVILGLVLFYAMVACSSIARKIGGAVRLG